jgi:hypothetical protein
LIAQGNKFEWALKACRISRNTVRRHRQLSDTKTCNTEGTGE